jgi:hypothetical protein
VQHLSWQQSAKAPTDAKVNAPETNFLSRIDKSTFEEKKAMLDWLNIALIGFAFIVFGRWLLTALKPLFRPDLYFTPNRQNVYLSLRVLRI